MPSTIVKMLGDEYTVLTSKFHVVCYRVSIVILATTLNVIARK